jgi:hypothetical protein
MSLARSKSSIVHNVSAISPVGNRNDASWKGLSSGVTNGNGDIKNDDDDDDSVGLLLAVSNASVDVKRSSNNIDKDRNMTELLL